MVTLFAIHAFYADWLGGTGSGSRYMVPMVPLLMLALDVSAKPTRWFAIAGLYSLRWGLARGFMPVLVYDRAPWKILLYSWIKLRWGTL